MGKDKKKKGKGAEKTAIKTEKKLIQKFKKSLAEKGEDDVESIVQAIEEEEKKKRDVKEMKVDPPSHRSNFSWTPHPDYPEIVMFGGEFYNGKVMNVYNDLLIYNVKRNEWKKVEACGAPPPRSSHQAVISSTRGGQLWIFGGEYISPSETQFHHYKDLWVFHFSDKHWEKITSAGSPSSRSGHRMTLFKRHYLILFGGFHDNSRSVKYHNDVHVFDIENYVWKSISISGVGPSSRSGSLLFPTFDGKSLCLYGGYSKESKQGQSIGKKTKKKNEDEVGIAHSDMFLLSPDKHDENCTVWKWHSVKQVGACPKSRSGMSFAQIPGQNAVFVFGGVRDSVEDEDGKSSSTFYNDIMTLRLENEKGIWFNISLQEEKQLFLKDDDKIEKTIEETQNKLTKVVEDGAFIISSTIAEEEKPKDSISVVTKLSSLDPPSFPSPRFGAGLASKHGVLYLFGGIFEDEEDRQITLKDLYSLDTHKLDEWKTIIKSDVMEWIPSDDSEDNELTSEEESSDEMKSE